MIKIFKKTLSFLVLVFFFYACVSSGGYSPGLNGSASSSSEKDLMWPLEGAITSHFGPRSGSFHHGIDIKGEKDTNIYSAASGVIEFVGSMRGYGNTVIVKHEGFKTLYAHCYRLKVTKGQRVRKGQSIATVGTSGRSSGYHLHFEVRTLSDQKKDPLLYL